MSKVPIAAGVNVPLMMGKIKTILANVNDALDLHFENVEYSKWIYDLLKLERLDIALAEGQTRLNVYGGHSVLL